MQAAARNKEQQQQPPAAARLDHVGELGVPVDDQPVHVRLQLLLLALLEGDVVLGQAGLALPVLQQDEPNLGRGRGGG